MAYKPAYHVTSQHSWSETEKKLRDTFGKWPVYRFAIEPSCLPRQLNSNYLPLSERAVTVRFWLDDREVVLTSTDQERPVDNLKKLQLGIEDMRMIDRRGMREVMESAYLQLAAPAAQRDPWEVLGLRPGASPEMVEAMYRTIAKQVHPDAGGSDEAMAELTDARNAVLKEAGR